MLQRLLTYHEVMPNFLDFLGVFQRHEKPRHIRFSSFRDQDLVSSNQPNLMELLKLGRSGRQYQICYNLKSVEQFENKWSVRQAAAHHQFDFKNGNTLWMFAQGHWDLQGQLNAMISPTWVPGDRGLKFDSIQDCFRSTFTIHQMFIEWSNRKWKEYLASIEDDVEALVSICII
jgi:hypothetical protein